MQTILDVDEIVPERKQKFQSTFGSDELVYVWERELI